MENVQRAFDATTAVIRGGLTWLDVRPESYRFLFPAGKDAETIRKLVADGYFPTIPHLAPAFTYASVLSLVRFFMQLLILKVCTRSGMTAPGCPFFHAHVRACVASPIALSAPSHSLRAAQPLALRAMKLRYPAAVTPNADIEKTFPSSSKKQYEVRRRLKRCKKVSRFSSSPTPALSHRHQDSEINAICKDARLDADEVRRHLWCRKRTAFVSKKVSKFTEAFWRFLMYAVFCVIGYHTLFVPTVAPWILDTNQHWDKWPSHRITATVEFYYHVQLGAVPHENVRVHALDTLLCSPTPNTLV